MAPCRISIGPDVSEAVDLSEPLERRALDRIDPGDALAQCRSWGGQITEGQTLTLEPGDSWVVPTGANHDYRILEAFTAVEATSPPARAGGQDEA